MIRRIRYNDCCGGEVIPSAVEEWLYPLLRRIGYTHDSSSTDIPIPIPMPARPIVAGFSQEEQEDEWDSAAFAEFFGAAEASEPFG